jgi:STE24 endopeptidase
MLLTILVSIVVAAYIVESLLDRLNQSTARNPLDPKIAHLYDPIEREKSIAYSAEKTNFGFISSTFSTVIMILALALGWFAVLDELIRERFDNEIVISLLFIAVLSVISWWLNLPFQLYSIFKIEAKYGFNKTTVATFISDAIKGSAIAVVLGGFVAFSCSLALSRTREQLLDICVGSRISIFVIDVHVRHIADIAIIQQT